MESISITTWIFIGMFMLIQAIFSLIFLGMLIYTIWSGLVVRSWASTTGTVISSEFSDTKNRRIPYVYYQYRVQDKEYTNNTIAPGPVTGGKGAQAVIKKYPVGATVPVYFNSENPSQSVLERKGPILSFFLWLILINIIFCGIEILIPYMM